MTELTDAFLRTAFEGEFQTYCQEPGIERWRNAYLEEVQRVRSADEATWMTPAFQQSLWEDDGVTSIGAGNAVTVRRAYSDTKLAKLLFDARQAPRPADVTARGAQLQALYEQILAWVYPNYSPRRPRARIVRLLGAMFPEDMTCLADTWRVWSLQRALGTRIPGDFVAQHPAIRNRLRAVLGDPADLAGTVDQAVFSWFLWMAYVDRPDEGAVQFAQTQRTANDLPPLSLLPPNAQRRGLNCITDNVRVLVGMVREAEHGITRDDLVNVILAEASFLAVSSTPNVISQAQGGLGLIRLVDGAYVPTERGLEFLTAQEPAHVLRAPLVGRVFGMGHLLKMLADEPGLTANEVATRLQAVIPTWTSKMGGSQLVQWGKLVGFVRADTSTGVGKLILTEDGEDYAAALPSDFEQRWRIEVPEPSIAEAEMEGEDAPACAASKVAAVASPYSVQHILDEGCFIAPEEVSAALALLKRKKNLVLQGPPGTGKTWLARRLGYALLGVKDCTRVTAVQFQPSLSYEDFVRGWRPDGKAGLRLADGLFLETVETALQNPELDYVLVIEEINRGNPAQIFGELLTLLETDKRNEREALRLAYPRHPDERVYIPENLYVIGTMNLADRSLALVDLALRRRFAFLTLKPELGPAWRSWCQKAGAPDDVVEEIAHKLASLNEAIAGDRSLGEQFCIGHSFVTPQTGMSAQGAGGWRPWFRAVVETEVAPLLSEYWYDNPASAAEHRTKLLQGF